MQEVFAKYANGAEMDGKTLAKLTKDCKLLNKELKPTDVDLIFAKSKERTARKINYQQFLAAIEACGKKRGESMDKISAIILA